jgi:hypothetical protein
VSGRNVKGSMGAGPLPVKRQEERR